jgi:hypothetical protein
MRERVGRAQQGWGRGPVFHQGTSTSCFAKCLLSRLPSPPSPKTVRQTTINSTSCLVVRVLLFLCQRGCVRVWRGGYAGCCGHPPAGLCQLASTAGASDQQQRRHSRRWCSPGPSSASSHRCPARSSPVCGGQDDLGLTTCRSCGPVVLSPRLPAWRALCQDTRRPCCCSHAYVLPLGHWLPLVSPWRCLLPHIFFVTESPSTLDPLWPTDSPPIHVRLPSPCLRQQKLYSPPSCTWCIRRSVLVLHAFPSPEVCCMSRARPHSTPLDTLSLLSVRFTAFSNTSHQQHLTLSLPWSCAPPPRYACLQQGEGDGPAMDLVRTVASVTDWATAAGVVPRVSAIIACACPPHALASVALQDDLGSSSRDHVRDGYVLQNVCSIGLAPCALTSEEHTDSLDEAAWVDTVYGR